MKVKFTRKTSFNGTVYEAGRVYEVAEVPSRNVEVLEAPATRKPATRKPATKKQPAKNTSVKKSPRNTAVESSN